MTFCMFFHAKLESENKFKLLCCGKTIHNIKIIKLLKNNVSYDVTKFKHFANNLKFWFDVTHLFNICFISYFIT